MSARAVSRAGITAALYVVLTMCFGEMAYGPFQIRPSEALCVLPLIYAESVPGIAVGCLLANIISGYGIYDIFFGTAATLAAACLTWLTGKHIKGNVARVAAGGAFPVLFNAFAVPAIWLLAGEDASVYLFGVISVFVTETVWVYGLGSLLYAAVHSLAKRGVRGFVPESGGRAPKKTVKRPGYMGISRECAPAEGAPAGEGGISDAENTENTDISGDISPDPRENGTGGM